MIIDFVDLPLKFMVIRSTGLCVKDLSRQTLGNSQGLISRLDKCHNTLHTWVESNYFSLHVSILTISSVVEGAHNSPINRVVLLIGIRAKESIKDYFFGCKSVGSKDLISNNGHICSSKSSCFVTTEHRHGCNILKCRKTCYDGVVGCCKMTSSECHVHLKYKWKSDGDGSNQDDQRIKNSLGDIYFEPIVSQSLNEQDSNHQNKTDRDQNLNYQHNLLLEHTHNRHSFVSHDLLLSVSNLRVLTSAHNTTIALSCDDGSSREDDISMISGIFTWDGLSSEWSSVH
mmetsp:Transcript_32816/g.67140  ORF Transcript_32816/g.67140 Transcript_32816/m.67140 type:complete len:286 (-) Transcript_32816:570-1427(-)